MKCVDELVVLVGFSPEDAGDRVYDWAVIEGSLDLRLPLDYKLLVERFSPGVFQGLVRLNRPGDGDHPMDEFFGANDMQLGEMRGFREAAQGVFPHPIYPEPGGLVPWGRGPLGGPLCWLTEEADPNAWPVVVVDEHYMAWQVFPGGVCDFLTAVVEGRFGSGIYRYDPLSGPPVFEPDEVVQVSEPAGTPGSFYWEWLGRAAKDPVDQFDRLAELIGEPRDAARPIDWDVVERRLGAGLPTDYKRFAETYGAGTFCDIVITVPGGSGEGDLFALIDRKYAQVRTRSRTEYDPPVHPEETGVIYWGETMAGHSLGWAPLHLDPDRWGIVVSVPTVPPLCDVGLLPRTTFSGLLVGHAEGKRKAPRLEPWRGPARFVAQVRS